MADVSEDYIHEWRKKLLCLCAAGEDCLRLLLRFYLNPDPTVDTDKKLANLFKNAVAKKFDVIYKSKINSLSFPSNDRKIYAINATGNKVVKDSINIDELDITLMGDILKNIQYLMSTTGTIAPCQNGHKRYCCDNRNHKCTKCNKVVCNNTPKKCCVGIECDHACSNCGCLHSFSKRQNTICCSTCKCCLNCAAHCNNYIMQHKVDVIKRELRNCSMHLTNKECENTNFDFPEIDQCNNWSDTLKKFVDTLRSIIKYLFSENYIEEEVRDAFFLKITNIQTGKALYKDFEKAIYILMKSEQEYDYLEEKVTENLKQILRFEEEIFKHTDEINKRIQCLQNDMKDQRSHSEDILNMKKNLEEVRLKTQLITEKEYNNNERLATRDCLNQFARLIDKDWKRLSRKLGVNVSLWKQIVTISKSCEECMHETYRKVDYKIPWEHLRKNLLEIDREDIISLLKTQSSITIGDEIRRERTSKLRIFYQEQLTNWSQSRSFKGKQGKEYVTRNRNDAYVQLMVGGWIDAHENDKEHFLRAMNSQENKIDMHELLDGNENLIIIRGIAGIGKTSFVDSFVLNWADEEIYKDYDVVIRLTCRELNVMNNVFSLRDLLDRSYPKHLSNIIFDSLNDADMKLLVMLDGLDEFGYLNDIVRISEGILTDHQLASIVYDLINPNFRQNTKILLCGRPQASEDIFNCFRQNGSYKLVEITGFDQGNVYLFIDKYFNEDKDKAESMKRKLTEQENLMAMARIPIYGYILCNVFDSGALIEELDTTTKLNIASCLVFLRDHMRNFNKKHVALIHMCKDPVIIQTVRDLSKFAYKSLWEQRIIFDEKDFCESKNLSNIQGSGIFEKHEGGENGDVYQFKHLVLQEFLCAIHIIDECIDMEELTQNRKLNNSMLISMGLIGLLHNESTAPDYLKDFAKAVVEFEKEKVKEFDSSVTTFIQFFPVDKAERILYAVHEFNCVLPKSLQGYLMNQSLTLTIRFHHELQRLVYFLKNVKTKSMSVEIRMKDGSSIYSKEFRLFAPYSVKIHSLTLKQNPLASNLDYMAQCILDSQKQCENLLKKLNISSCNIGDTDLIAFSKAIPCLQSLNLCYNREISSKGFNLISQDIYDSQKKNENYLKRLDLGDCNLSDESIIALSKAIPCFESLHLGGSKSITPKGFNEMSTVLCDSQKQNENYLKELDLRYCNLSYESIIVLSKAIPCLESLHLGGSKGITAIGFNEMSTVICASQKQNLNYLKRLDLGGCNLSGKSLISLSKAIPCLESLSLFESRDITPKGFNEMSTVIWESQKQKENYLKRLDLGGCNLSDDSIIALSKSIPCLESLSLMECRDITPNGFNEISTAICDSQKQNENYLKELDLRNCNLSDESIIAVSKAVPCLESLHLGGSKGITPN